MLAPDKATVRGDHEGEDHDDDCLLYGAQSERQVQAVAELRPRLCKQFDVHSCGSQQVALPRTGIAAAAAAEGIDKQHSPDTF